MNIFQYAMKLVDIEEKLINCFGFQMICFSEELDRWPVPNEFYHFFQMEDNISIKYFQFLIFIFDFSQLQFASLNLEFFVVVVMPNTDFSKSVYQSHIFFNSFQFIQMFLFFISSSSLSGSDQIWISGKQINTHIENIS